MNNLSPNKNAVAERPDPRHATPLSQVDTLDGFFSRPDVIQRFQQSVPKHMSPDRMLRVCALALQKNPELAKCTPLSLLGAMLVLASLGLEPNTPLGLSYLIPFKRSVKKGNGYEEVYEVQVIIGYKGYIDLARRSGNLVSIHADVVYEGDEFSYEYGSNMHLRHKPVGDNEGKQPLYAYAHVKLTDGEAFEVLPFSRVLKLRNSSQGYQAALKAKAAAEANSKDGWKIKTYNESPWVKHLHEMAAKTMIRRVQKTLPMSVEMAQASEIDERNDFAPIDFTPVGNGNNALVDMTNIIDATPEETTPQQPKEETGTPEAQKAETAPEAKKEAKPAETKPTGPIVLISNEGDEEPYPTEDDAMDAVFRLLDQPGHTVDSLTGWLESQDLSQFSSTNAAMIQNQTALRIRDATPGGKK